MIENKCTQWYESERCTVKNLIEYIEKKGQMRDAQIEAIKVYLFLKIACECKPLTQLFRQGFFNSIDLNEIELSKSTREYLFQNPAAAALFEYACLTNDKGEQVSEKLEKQIKKDPAGIDYNEFLRNAFYGVSYTDYGFYSSEDKYIVKLKVDYIKHNTTVAFPTILFVKNEIDEIPYKITSMNNPDVVEGCIKVKS